MKRAAAIAVAVLSLVATARPARADDALVHIVRSGETLASIAQRFYGDPRRERVLVAENGLTAQGGADVVVGMRLLIPAVIYHRVVEGETWGVLAARFYGDMRRTTVLLDANSSTPGSQPDVGTELVVPYPVRHVAGQHDTVATVARDYYGDADKASLLRRFNGLRTSRLNRGDVILVPIADLTLSEEGRRLADEERGHSPEATDGHVRDRQEQINAQLPELRDFVRQGQYTEAVALGNRLLGAAEVLTGNQVVTIQRELGTAYVALDRDDLAATAFRAALEMQPDLELDRTRTSPRVLRSFQAAQTARAHAAAMPAAVADAGVPDAH